MTSFIQTFANKGGHRRSIAMKGIEAWTMGSHMTFNLCPTINFKVCFMLTAVYLGLHFRFIHSCTGVWGIWSKFEQLRRNTMAMKDSLYHSARLIFLLSLATTQLIFFGVPCINRFTSSGIGEEKIFESHRALKPPCVTLCPFQHNQQ